MYRMYTWNVPVRKLYNYGRHLVLLRLLSIPTTSNYKPASSKISDLLHRTSCLLRPYTLSQVPTEVIEYSAPTLQRRKLIVLTQRLGIGLALVTTYLARPFTTVIAGVRDPKPASTKSLINLQREPSSTLIIVRIDSLSETDPSEAIKLLEAEHNISHLDVVIANAGIAKSYSTIAQVPVGEVREHININSIGALILFQAVLPILQKSKGPGKFITVSSPLGSIGGMEMRPFSMGAYGISKAMLNYLTRKIHFETDNIIAFALDPGQVHQG